MEKALLLALEIWKKLNQKSEFSLILLFTVKAIACQSQYMPLIGGITLETGYSNKLYAEIGYGLSYSGYYIKNDQNEMKSKRFLLHLDQKIGYILLEAVSFKTSPRISFEFSRWNSKLINYNVGLDYIHLTNFSYNNNIICPKIGVTVYYGTIELNYGYNIIIGRTDNLNCRGHSVGSILRPYIFSKSMKQKWSEPG